MSLFFLLFQYYKAIVIYPTPSYQSCWSLKCLKLHKIRRVMLLTIYSYWSYKILPIKVSTMQRSLVFYNVWFILVIYVTDYFFNHRKIIIHEKGEKKDYKWFKVFSTIFFNKSLNLKGAKIILALEILVKIYQGCISGLVLRPLNVYKIAVLKITQWGSYYF